MQRFDARFDHDIESVETAAHPWRAWGSAALPGSLVDIADGATQPAGLAREPHVAAETSASDARFRWLAGRRYLADVPYLLPRDEQEESRLDFQHYMLQQALQAGAASHAGRTIPPAYAGKALAPIGRPISVVDVGCGTGRWALEMAQAYPEASIIGFDRLPPTYDHARRTVPLTSCAWVEGNLLAGLPFVDGQFSYVHMRLLGLGIPINQWLTVARELVRVASPGGYVEVLDTTWTPTGAGYETETLFRWALEAALHHGINLQATARVGELLRDAGLINLVTQTFALPLGRPAGRVGALVAANALAALRAVAPLITTYGIASAEAFALTVSAARAELAAQAGQLAYQVVYGQRPA
jgi:SAM-dependent methyltransferase